MSEKIAQSLRYSLKDGICASIMTGISENFIVPYAILMGAGAAMIGFLVSIPNLAASLVQLRSAWLTERLGSRKALITNAVLAHLFMWIPIILIPYCVATAPVTALIICYTLLIAFGALSVAPWSSLMADHVGPTERGKVFGWRNRLFGIINITSMFLAGLVLFSYKNFIYGRFPAGSPEVFKYLGFTVIFIVACLARFFSWRFLTRMYEPPLEIRAEHRFTFLDFLKRIRHSNFGRFVIFVSFMNFAVNISSPFLALYMLRDLGFDYLSYTVITLAATLTMNLAMNTWGIHADTVGNRRVLRLASLYLPVIPILWLFSHHKLYLIAIQIVGGFFWAGFNLSASNFIYDAVTPEKRTRCVAYFNVVNGFAIALGAATGGMLVRIMPPLLGYRILAVLAISGVVRCIGAALCSVVREVRTVKKVSSIGLFYSIIGLRPIVSLPEAS